MKANELRIGNWVSKHGEIYQITSATIVCLERGESDVKPIAITPEWLQRFGFEKIGNGWQLDVEINHYCLYSESGKYVDLFVFSDEVGQQCQYIHQLQNLYFALTGEELEIKPNI